MYFVHIWKTYHNIFGATYWARLAILLRRIVTFGCCWFKFENGQIFHETFVVVAWCNWFCQVRATYRNTSQKGGQMRTTCCAAPTMCRYFALKCCDRLAWARLQNNCFFFPIRQDQSAVSVILARNAPRCFYSHSRPFVRIRSILIDLFKVHFSHLW